MHEKIRIGRREIRDLQPHEAIVMRTWLGDKRRVGSALRDNLWHIPGIDGRDTATLWRQATDGTAPDDNPLTVIGVAALGGSGFHREVEISPGSTGRVKGIPRGQHDGIAQDGIVYRILELSCRVHRPGRPGLRGHSGINGGLWKDRKRLCRDNCGEQREGSARFQDEHEGRN